MHFDGRILCYVCKCKYCWLRFSSLTSQDFATLSSCALCPFVISQSHQEESLVFQIRVTPSIYLHLSPPLSPNNLHMAAYRRMKLAILALGITAGDAFQAPLSPLPITRSIGLDVHKYKAPFSPGHVGLQRNRLPTARFSSSPAAAADIASTSTSDSKNTIAATLVLILMDVQLRSLFTKYAIAFPSSLAGCGALFASMLVLDSFSGSKKWGQNIYENLNPGATLLAKWLPVFFVPSLITLPLASGLGNAYEVSSCEHVSICCTSNV